jgi:3-oxoacyl-[acyl-carrier protein] reductase
MKPWQECTALVTGGQGCIGRALVARLQALGVTVYSTARVGHDANVLAWDMVQPEASTSLVETLKGRQIEADLLIHCAHVFSDAKLIFQVGAEAFQHSLISNVVPLYGVMRHVGRGMSRRRFGRIALLGSLIAQYGGAGKVAYVVEKNAFNGLVRAFSAELGQAGVAVSVLHPSLVDTDTIRERVDAAIIDQLAAASENGRLLTVDQVVDALLPLIDPTREVDGGQVVELSGGARW